MLMLFLLFSFMLVLTILVLFSLFSKLSQWEESMSSSFECGYTSYFFSRYSFSMHYFVIGMMFLFLDLELCFIMPFFNGDFSSLYSYLFFFFFILLLIMSILFEWKKKMLEWKF